jgi:hypothetical protein
VSDLYSLTFYYDKVKPISRDFETFDVYKVEARPPSGNNDFSQHLEDGVNSYLFYHFSCMARESALYLDLSNDMVQGTSVYPYYDKVLATDDEV